MKRLEDDHLEAKPKDVTFLVSDSERWKEELREYLGCVVGAALVVGELEFAEGHFLSHPVSSSVWRVGVHVHPIPCNHINTFK